MGEAPEIRQTGIRLLPDNTRVIVRPFMPGDASRKARIVQAILALTPEQAHDQWARVMQRFEGRHPHIEEVFERHFRQVAALVPVEEAALDRERRLLIGAFFSCEYSLQSAALFNPSIVPHPDQSGLQPGALRFVLSLRAIGEGHLSSIEFRTGVIDSDGRISMEPAKPFAATAEVLEETSHDRDLLGRQMIELGHETPLTQEVLSRCGTRFSLQELQELIRERQQLKGGLSIHEIHSADIMTWVAESRHELQFRPDQPISERVIVPVSSDESRGIEDARFVLLTEDGFDPTYYATYSAYNGRFVLPQLLETKDFLRFKVSALYGSAVRNKGMALFPRKVGGSYAAITRPDGERLYLAYTDSIYFWDDAVPLMGPAHTWETVQIGNCGSPIETEAGWLLLTHGVGPMRRYCIGAALLDLEDPSRVIGRMRVPLIEPGENEREGYVPNVVYTCGALIHGPDLVLPYAMADYATTIALVSLEDLLNAMEPPR